MKKNCFYIICVMVILAITTGCSTVFNDEAMQAQQTEGDNTLQCSMEADNTRTEMSSSENGTYHNYWSEEDMIGVYVDSSPTPACYTLSTGAGTTAGSFAGNGKGENYVALYPYDNAGEMLDGLLNFNLPKEQNYNENSFGTGAYPMVAKSTSSNLQFKNLCAVLRLAITGTQTVQNIVFKSRSDAALVSGDATVSTDYTTTPTLVMSPGGSTEVVLNCGGVMLKPSTPTDFHIVIPAQMYTGGFTLTINTTSGYMVKEITSDVLMTRSQLRKVKEFVCKLDFGTEPSTSLAGLGVEKNPFLISSVSDLLLLQGAANSSNATITSSTDASVVAANSAYYQLNKDLDLSSVCNATLGSWTPIGDRGNNADHAFSGVFDGNNHTVSGLYIDNTASDDTGSYQGLFGYIASNGTVKNLTVTADISGYAYVGAICGENNFGTILNCISRGNITGVARNTGGICGEGFSKQCKNYATVTSGGIYTGGITGSKSGTCSDCTNYGAVKGQKYSGGIVGYDNAELTYNCHNEGSVSGTSHVGGIHGYTRQGAQTFNCYNTGSVTASTNYAGGIVGLCDCYSSSNFDTAVMNCFNSGAVDCAGSYTGGVCGLNVSTVSNCYWLYDPDKQIGTEQGIVNENGMATNNFSLTQEQLQGKATHSSTLYTSTDKTAYNTILDALNAWAADKKTTAKIYFGWKYASTDSYPSFTETEATKPGEDGDKFLLSKTEFSVGCDSSIFEITVTSSLEYSISSMPDWITETTQSATRAATTKTHTFTVAANTATTERIGTIVFCNSAKQCVPATVTQSAYISQDDTWKTKEFWHRSLAMRFAATWCSYCPNMETGFIIAQENNPDKIEVVNLHAASSQLEFDGTATLENQYFITGLPSGIIDGRTFIQNYSSSYIATLIANAKTETESNYTTSSGIAFTSTLSGTSISADIKLYVKKADSYKVTAVLLEDYIITAQADIVNGTQDKYLHKGIARIALTDISGEEFTTTADNQIVQKSYSVTIPESYNTANLRILVYVQRAFGSQTVIQSGEYGNYYVDNARSAAIGTQAKLQFADDSSLGQYSSSDYSADGTVTKLQSATTGNGIDLVITGDGFADTDMTKFDTYATKGMEAFFAEEPYTTYRNRFNVYSLKAVSKNNVFTDATTTKFAVAFGEGTSITGDLDGIYSFVSSKLPSVDLTKTLVIVMVNANRYAGTCHMVSNNKAISFCPLCTSDSEYASTLQHEAAGHGFGKLDDEYVNYNSTITSEVISNFNQWCSFAYGFNENVDVTNSTTAIKWAKLLADSRYSGMVGIYEGAHYYQYGAYRATDYSIMRYNTAGFNAPSREAIYKKIMRFSEGDSWTYNYENFVAYDAVNRSSSAAVRRAAQARRVDTKTFVPLAPPVRHIK